MWFPPKALPDKRILKGAHFALHRHELAVCCTYVDRNIIFDIFRAISVAQRVHGLVCTFVSPPGRYRSGDVRDAERFETAPVRSGRAGAASRAGDLSLRPLSS